MAFDSSKFRNRQVSRLIRRQAEEVICYTARRCNAGVTAYNLASRACDPNCTTCAGWGWWYSTTPIEIWGTVTGYQISRDPLELGVMERGDLTLSVEPRSNYVVGDYDKIILPNFEDGEPFSGEFVERGFSPTDMLRWPVQALDDVSRVDDRNYQPTIYVEGTDYSVSGDAIVWLPGGNQPAPGQIYSVRFRARFEWIAYNPTYSRHARGASQGQRVMLRRRDMMPLTGEVGTVPPEVSAQ